MKRLTCKVQHYQWGKRGMESIVGQLMRKTVEEDEYYAEIWMGTHPNGPSALLGENGEEGANSDDEEGGSNDGKQATSLKQYINQHPEMLGKHEGAELKFLFKVLSVGKALSMQSHPTKEQAKLLHANNPKNYPDDNHKPEMAIALTDFQLLCGFQKPQRILSNIKAHKELLEVIDEDNLTKFAHETDPIKQREALKTVFTQVWCSDEATVKHIVREIVARVFQKDDRAPVDDLILLLSEQFPEDIGILSPLFLNHLTLKPGEAVFFGPNEPHAYIEGDCIECMAVSDNTIRAGLTPKFKDVRNFCASLTYQMSDAPMFSSTELPNGIIEYAPPVEEFAVHKIEKRKNMAKLEPIDAASILIVLSGEATLGLADDQTAAVTISKSDVLFLPQQFGCPLTNQSEEFLAFRAFTPPPKN